jgi:signal transduction histidine kinase
LRQILRNLVTNAQHYGGRDIKVTTQQSNGAMQITVADSGPGIPAALRERIFEAYSTAHGDQGMPASVGLGLTVSRSLATLMGGSLSYHHVDGWSRMVLRLPADTEV